MNAFTERRAAVVRRVDAVLERCVPTVEAGGTLAQAMRHIVFAGGKRLRPALVLLANEHVGGHADEALGAAAAVELVHAYSLLHDDLPCMDDGELRRGKPCAHRIHGEAIALLAGDALLTLAFEVLARETLAESPLGEMVVALGEAAGWAGMVGGQVADLQAEGAAPDLERVRAIHAGKTAAMFAVSFRLGALAAGAPAQRAAALDEAGRDLGLAFQIVDDLHDVESSTEALGKLAGVDAEREKLTWPAVVGVEQARRDARALARQAVERAGPGRARAALEGLVELLLERPPVAVDGEQADGK